MNKENKNMEKQKSVTDKFLPVGTRVKTLTPAGSNDWVETLKQSRKWGVVGTIVDYSDSHGLCYKVKHDNGTESWYNPEELEEVNL